MISSMHPVTGLLLWLPTLAPLGAGEILEQRVWTEGDRYLVHLEAHLAAPAARIRERLTDYAHLHHLSPTITESRLIAADPPVFTVQVLSEGCVAFFCRQIRQLQQVTDRDDGFIVVEDVPGQSDFRKARAVWRIQSLGQHKTRLLYRAEFLPDFWIPPFIGPALFRLSLKRETRHLFDSLERLASDTVEP